MYLTGLCKMVGRKEFRRDSKKRDFTESSNGQKDEETYYWPSPERTRHMEGDNGHKNSVLRLNFTDA